MAVAELPAASRIRVTHVGKAHDASWAKRAQAAMRSSPRYRWRGEVPHWKVRELYRRSRLMVLSSKMEGGANVISEAIIAGLPVIASAISGSIGLLGVDYPGYYPVGDTRALRTLLLRACGIRALFLPGAETCLRGPGAAVSTSERGTRLARAAARTGKAMKTLSGSVLARLSACFGATPVSLAGCPSAA